MKRAMKVGLGVLGAGVFIGAMGCSRAASPSITASPAASQSPVATQAPVPTTQAPTVFTPAAPTAVPITKVEFIISGYAPGDPACGGGCGPTIEYGSDSDTHNLQPDEINGTVTYTVPFDPNASYYAINVNTTTSSSHLTCKIVAIGPSPDAPTTVSSGSETGSGICSAQAAPADSTGESWTNEQP